MKVKLFLIILAVVTSIYVQCRADEFERNGIIFYGVQVFPGSVKIIQTKSSHVSGMAVYQNMETIDANYNYYESHLLSMGWKISGILKQISSSIDMPVMVMEKDNKYCYICFYKDSDNWTFTVLIIQV